MSLGSARQPAKGPRLAQENRKRGAEARGPSSTGCQPPRKKRKKKTDGTTRRTPKPPKIPRGEKNHLPGVGDDRLRATRASTSLGPGRVCLRAPGNRPPDRSRNVEHNNLVVCPIIGTGGQQG